MNKWRVLASQIFRFFFPIDNVTKYKRMGARIGKNVYIAYGATIDPSHAWLVKIGNNVGIAPFTHILAHDGTTKGYLNYARVGIVDIQDNAIIGAGCIILPGIKIGKSSIIGSGSVVTKNIPDNCVAAGNPAKVICSLDEYIKKQKALVNNENCFDESFTLRGNITKEKMDFMFKTIEKHGIGFVE